MEMHKLMWLNKKLKVLQKAVNAEVKTHLARPLSYQNVNPGTINRRIQMNMQF
tara:strand:+ start:738 stop:896 length:159 start_codon:yes stop_codon:yes gene_type:complete